LRIVAESNPDTFRATNCDKGAPVRRS